MPSSFRLLLAVALLSCTGTPLPAWDAPAHEIIAVLAGERLNAKARDALAKLATELQTPGPAYNSINIACWMDDLKRADLALPDHGKFYAWHYIDIGIEAGDPVPSFQPGDDNPYCGNVVQALERASVVLRGGTDPYIANPAVACAMAMHLVGDIHQPLHAATHYFRTAGGWLHQDAGGNKEYVDNGPANQAHGNLHQFWDSAWRASFDESTGRVVIDPRFQEGPQDLPTILQTARELDRLPSPTASLEPNFQHWAEESHQLAESFVYPGLTATNSKKYCRLSSSYVVGAAQLSRQQLLLAACRLATLLNETLGRAAPGPIPPSYPAGPPRETYAPSP